MDQDMLSLENILGENYQHWNKKNHYDSSSEMHLSVQSQSQEWECDFLKMTEEYMLMHEDLTKKLAERKRIKERITALLEEKERREKYNKMKLEFIQRHQEVALLLKSVGDEKKELVPLSEDVNKRIATLFHGQRIFQYQLQFPEKQPLTKSGSDGSFFYLSFSLGDLPESHIIISCSVL